MNDDFLTRFRKPPRRAFVAQLYNRINTPMNTQRNFTFRRFSFAAAIGLALIAALTFSPSARAALDNLIKQIGGITYIQPEETTDVATPPPDEVSRVREERINLSQIQEKVPFEISLPTWVPDGYEVSESVLLRYFNEKFQFATISWWGANFADGPIELMVGQPVNWAMDLAHVEEVQINGQPAGLAKGGWDADTGEWGGSGAGNLTLTWMRGDLMYQLRSPGVTPEELIRVAESIP